MPQPNAQPPAANSHLLYSEQARIVIPSLAYLVGDREAMLLQQIHFWMTMVRRDKTSRKGQQRRGPDGHLRTWIEFTQDEWHEEFFFWSKRTLRRKIDVLVEEGVVLKCKFERQRGDHTYWYTIDYDRLNDLHDGFDDPREEDPEPDPGLPGQGNLFTPSSDEDDDPETPEPEGDSEASDPPSESAQSHVDKLSRSDVDKVATSGEGMWTNCPDPDVDKMASSGSGQNGQFNDRETLETGNTSSAPPKKRNQPASLFSGDGQAGRAGKKYWAGAEEAEMPSTGDAARSADGVPGVSVHRPASGSRSTAASSTDTASPASGQPAQKSAAREAYTRLRSLEVSDRKAQYLVNARDPQRILDQIRHFGFKQRTRSEKLGPGLLVKMIQDDEDIPSAVFEAEADKTAHVYEPEEVTPAAEVPDWRKELQKAQQRKAERKTGGERA